MEHGKLYRVYDLIGRRIGLVAIAVLVVVAGLGAFGSLSANTEEPNFDPRGEVFDTLYRSESTLHSESSIVRASFLVEAGSGHDNALSPSAMREWQIATEVVAGDQANQDHLTTWFDTDATAQVPGVFSVVEAVNNALAGGIGSATDEEIQAATVEVLADGSPTAFLRYSLAEGAALIGEGSNARWESPAFMTTVTYDEGTFGEPIDGELWLREVQAQFREGAQFTDSIGVGIDSESTFGEATTQSAPFIFLAVGLIVLLVVAVHRSYWSATVVAAGLAATVVAYYGTSVLIGLKMGSLLLAFIVPIAMISFGVDFYIHGVGRVREMQVEDGLQGSRAYPAGMTAVFMAMLLAVSSSIAAFAANSVSGTEAIVQFGFGAAAALAWAYLILGQIAPRITVWLEEYVGPNPTKRWSRPAYALGAVAMAVVGGLMVAAGALMPIVGVVLLAVFLAAAIWFPAVLTRRRNRRAINRGKNFQPQTGGVGHGLEPVGKLVGGLARWRVVTIPVVMIVAILGLMQALQVESGFEIKDFISSKSDFAQSIERTTNHFPSTGEGSSIVYIEGDLTDPVTLARISGLVDDLDASSAQFGRNADGEVLVGLHAGDVVTMVMASPAAADLGLVDADGNGLPDSPSGVERALQYAWANGVPSPDGSVAIAALDVPGIVAETDTGQATAVVIQVGSYTDGAIIEPVREAMEVAAASFENDTTATTAIVTGEVIVSYLSMEAFTKSMLVSVPLAALLTFLIAAAMLRSVRYALVSVIPIGLVVMGIYSFMSIANFRVNVVSATIAAIAVGVGIDFSTHFTVRYREELAVDGSRLDAVRRAGAGTGGALVLSAVTSVLGFTVMAFAPMPIFATFGILTAVMIVLALAVALLVLPSLLVLVTKDHAVTPEAPKAREAVLVG